jgi:hypothetical protein
MEKKGVIVLSYGLMWGINQLEFIFFTSWAADPYLVK